MRLSQIQPRPGLALGIDVSQYQLDVDWPELSIEWAYLRATIGDKTDTQFERNASLVRVPRGAYHVVTEHADAVRHAERFVDVVGAERSSLPPMLDFERGPIEQSTVDRAVACLDTIERLWGRRCLLYTYPSFVEQLWAARCDLSALGERPLWIAQYTQSHDRGPRTPLPWKQWMIWQCSGNRPQSSNAAQLPSGIDVDVNWLRGTVADLEALS